MSAALNNAGEPLGTLQERAALAREAAYEISALCGVLLDLANSQDHELEYFARCFAIRVLSLAEIVMEVEADSSCSSLEDGVARVYGLNSKIHRDRFPLEGRD